MDDNISDFNVANLSTRRTRTNSMKFFQRTVPLASHSCSEASFVKKFLHLKTQSLGLLAV